VDPRGAFREGSGAGQPGHRRGGHGDQGGVQARDPRQDRLPPPLAIEYVANHPMAG